MRRTMQSMAHIQETVRQQLQEVEIRMQESLRRHERITSEIIHAAVREQEARFEEKLRHFQNHQEHFRTEHAYTLPDNFDERLKRLEERMMERNGTQYSDQNENSPVALREVIGSMEERLLKLEESIGKALEESFPRVNAMLERLDKKSLPDAPVDHSSPSSSHSKNVSQSFPPATTSANTSIHLAANSSTPSTARTQATVFPSQSRTTLQKQLSEAAKHGRVEHVQRLLDAGAQVNFNDDAGWNPLHYAANSAQADVVSLLIERGANVNAKASCTNTALLLASLNDTSGRCLTLLIDAGADVNYKNNHGDTALHIAVKESNHWAISILLAAGARRTDRNKFGNRPIDCAHSLYIRHQLLRL